MAEFQEVVRQIKRMCDSYGASCHGCPAKEKSGLCTLAHGDDFIPEDWEVIKAAEIELIVKHWAAEHPEPRYPSWNEVWQRCFPKAKEGKPPCVRYMLDKEQYEELCDRYDFCEECHSQPIPADIAEKLGIKPVGGCGNG